MLNPASIQIYKELSKKYNLPHDEIAKIVETQFEFTKKVIASGEDKKVRLQYLGTFEVKEGRRAVIEARSKLMKERYEKSRQEKQRGDI